MPKGNEMFSQTSSSEKRIIRALVKNSERPLKALRVYEDQLTMRCFFSRRHPKLGLQKVIFHLKNRQLRPFQHLEDKVA
jgi:hypothetical protein